MGGKRCCRCLHSQLSELARSAIGGYSSGEEGSHMAGRRMIGYIEDVVDLKTGEVAQALMQDRVGKRRRARKIGSSYVMFDAAALEDLELTVNERRIVNTLLALADRHDRSCTRASVSLIALRSGIGAANVSKNLTALRKRNIVFKIQTGYWLVNPWIAFAGEWAEWDKAAMQFVEPTWKRGEAGDA